MSGIGCAVIINCGIVKGAANGMAYYLANDFNGVLRKLGAAAAELRDQDDELCRFGEVLLTSREPIVLTEEQEEAIAGIGTRAKALANRMDDFVFTDSRDKDVAAKLLADVLAFTRAQRDVFTGIVGEGYGG